MDVGAKMADWILMTVPLGSIIVGGPNPSSSCFWPVIVVIIQDDGVTEVKYLRSLRMECEVPLSIMQLVISCNEGRSWSWIITCNSGESRSFTYSMRSSFNLRNFPCGFLLASVRLA